METKANYVMVGSFVVVLFLAGLGFVLWLAKFQSDLSYQQYDIRFPGSVSGLRSGSTVSYRGIGVGEVVDIRIEPDNVEAVMVTIEIDADTPIKTDTVASLEIAGLTGGALVMLGGGTQATPPLEPAPGQARAVIPATPSQLQRLLQGAPALVERVDLLVQQATRMLGPDNQRALSDTLANISTLSGALASRQAAIENVVDDASAAMKSVRGAAEAIETTTTALQGDAVAFMRNANNAASSLAQPGGNASGAIQSAEDAAEQLSALIAENRVPISDFSSTTLYEISSFVTELRQLVVGLNRVTTDVGRDPTGFIFGRQQRGYEVR